MTLFELGLSNGSISLATLLDGDETSTLADEIPIPELVELTCIGGWPALVGSSVAEAQGVLAGYLDSIARTDIRRLDGVARDPRKVRATVRSLARNVASQASVSTAARDAGGAGRAGRRRHRPLLPVLPGRAGSPDRGGGPASLDAATAIAVTPTYRARAPLLRPEPRSGSARRLPGETAAGPRVLRAPLREPRPAGPPRLRATPRRGGAPPPRQPRGWTPLSTTGAAGVRSR